MHGQLISINDPINGVVWGWLMVLLIAFTGIVLMLGLRHAAATSPLWRSQAVAARSRDNGGDISPFQALMTSLSATIGTGNIAGVAAIAMAARALCLMWVIAVFGIATKYAEAVLAVRYRKSTDSAATLVARCITSAMA